MLDSWIRRHGSQNRASGGIEYNTVWNYGDYYGEFMVLNYNENRGYGKNEKHRSRRYTYFQKEDENFYIGNIFDRARVLSYTHTHPESSEPSPDDILFSRIYGVIGYVLGWNGIKYTFGGTGYFR